MELKALKPAHLSDMNQKALEAIIEYYKTHTARETCIAFYMPFDRKNIKLLNKHYPKNMGLGGARKGSGNKKGCKLKRRKTSS